MTVLKNPSIKDFFRLRLPKEQRPWVEAPEGCDKDAFRKKVDHAVTKLSGKAQDDELLKIYKEFYPVLWEAENQAEAQKQKAGQEKSKQKKEDAAAAAAAAASSPFSASRATDDSDDAFQVMDLEM